MIKQKVEKYDLDVVDLEKELEAEFEAGYIVVSMISVTDRYDMPIKGLSQTHTVYVVYEYEETINYPKMYSIGIALLKNKDVKIYRTLMFEHVKGRRDESVYYTYLPNERTKEYKDIMEYCYLNNITLFEVKANDNRCRIKTNTDR